MKSLFTSILLIFSAITFAQIPSYVPSNGLVGWWPFNGNANDESGNGNNGTVNGATLTADRFGVADKAYSFDGVNDKIIVSTVNMTSDFSIGFWFKMNSNNFQYPIGLGINNGNTVDLYNGYGIGFSSSNPPCQGMGISKMFINDAVSTCSPWIELLNSSSIQTWHYLVISRTNNEVKMYFNGIHNTSGTNLNFLGILSLVFGVRTDNFAYFNGSLDDIGIWNRALTECEIKDLYYAQLGYSTVDAGADQTICRGDLVTLQGAGVGSLAWDNGVIDGVPFEPAQSGAYVLTGADSLDCIGTDTVQVTVLENASSTINQTAIDSYTLNGQTYTQSGTYTQVVPAANGCDSVITLNLELDFTGIQSHTNTSLQLYPNPVKDVMTLVGLKGEAVSFAVYSVDGKLIKSGQTSGEIQLEDLKKGNYLLKIENEALPFVKL
jgi:hypothetical protein